MTIQGGVVEQKTIGVKIGTNGTFINTELVGNNVELSKIENTNYYHAEGEWISEVVDIGDDFQAFGKVFVTNIDSGNSNIIVQTRTSEDGITFDSWINASGTSDILSVKRRYISIKVIFHAGTGLVDNYISEFKDAMDSDNFYNSMYINTSNGLVLNREYSYPMELDSNWSGEGSLHKKKLLDNDWLKIDKLNVPTTGTELNKTLILHDGEYKKIYKNIEEIVTETPNTNIVPIMTADISPTPFVASASSTNSTPLDSPYKAFNRTTSSITQRDFWYTGGVPLPTNGHWLKIDTGETGKYIVNSYTMSSVGNYSPVNWTFEGSNDDVYWVMLGLVTNATFASDITKNTYNFINTKPYRYYRVRVTKSTNASNYTIISTLELKGFVVTKSYVDNGYILESLNTIGQPTSEKFLTDGMDSLSPLLDRKVQKLLPQPMLDKSDILSENEKGKVFSSTLDLNKYFDIKSINVKTI